MANAGYLEQFPMDRPKTVPIINAGSRVDGIEGCSSSGCRTRLPRKESPVHPLSFHPAKQAFAGSWHGPLHSRA